MWILQQGQYKDWKMLSKSKCRAYVGFDKGSNALKFYNAETHKVIISQNFYKIHISTKIHTAELIVIRTNPCHEGESGDGDMLLDPHIPWMGRTSPEVITLDFSFKWWCITDFGNDPISETESDGKTLNLGK